MELAWLSVESGSVPVKDAVGRVGILLNFVDEEAGADGVEAAGGDEDGFAGRRLHDVDFVFNGAVVDGVFERLLGRSRFESDVEFRLRVTVGNVPHFSFGFATELARD